MGRLIPAGTGMKHYRNVKVDYDPTIDIKVPEEMDELAISGNKPGDIPLVKSTPKPKAIKKAKAEVAVKAVEKAVKAAKADASTDVDDDF